MAISSNHSNGVLTNVLLSNERNATANRVERFARTREMMFGILRTFFIAYAFEESLLQMAEMSSDVVQVKTISPSEGSKCIMQDNLILKRINSEIRRKDLSYRSDIPDVIAPAPWIEKMRLKIGDKLVVCRPPIEYSIPPPEIRTLH